jgi:Predicted integral membrane protein (DUF2269)
MGWDDLAKLVHILVAFGFITGLLGRWILLGSAAKAEEVETAYRLSQAAAPFEKLVIQGGNLVLPAGLLTAWAQGYEWLGLTTGWMLVSVVILLSVLPLVPLVFLPRGKVFEAAMSAARVAGTVTPELRAAFRDPAVAFAHRYELGAVTLVVALMVLKPF